MLFNSFQYVLFLLVTVISYWNVPKQWRAPLLLLASYFFYMSWSPPFGLIFGPVIFLDSCYLYWLSRAMIRWPEKKKLLVTIGITTELMFLGYFKYSSFIVHSVEMILRWLGAHPAHFEVHVILPLAISFTSFVLISYLVDVYRGQEKPDPSFIRFASYVAFFPHLIAGPIVRASELLAQIDICPDFRWPGFVNGIHRFLAGYALKVFIADSIANYVNMVYNTPSLYAFNTCWIATYGFAIQIFCDFFGYTLMAQGSALMLGYTLPENFNAPYFAINIADFWRRWHMSLSRWLRDYLYIPLGGSRCSRLKTYCNLFITMGLGGLWHGASWNFVIWGLYHGLLLSIHRLQTYLKVNRFIPSILSLLLTFHAVCIGWVFFRAEHFSTAFGFLKEMIYPAHILYLPGTHIVLLGIISFLLGHWLIRRVKPRIQGSPIAICCVQGIAYFLFIYLSITIHPLTRTFIYFQF